MSKPNYHSQLRDRTHAMGITADALARRTGLSAATIKRILAGGPVDASFDAVARVAEALGLSLSFQPVADAETLREEQAERKARELVALVQGNAALEAQAVDERAVRRMIERTKQELLKSRRKLWAA